jgi:hypothetical protein
MIMKTSKVLLLFAGTAIIVVMVLFSLILHKEIHHRRSAFGKVTYRMIPAGDFNRLVLSKHAKVRIRQGKNCVVEYALGTDSLKPLITNLNGTLHIESGSAFGSADLPQVKITMPSLLEISALQDAEILLGYFQADSMHVTLGAGCVFNGSDNTLKKVTFNTSGNALINISSTF